jgi:hypothetical protein
MELKELFKELKSRESYVKFKEENPTAYLSAGVFVFGEEGDKIQLDFLIPEQKKMASSEYPFNSFRIHEEEIKIVKEIENLNLAIDIKDVKNYVKEKTKKDFPKIIAILINDEWNLTCINGMDIYRIKVNAYNKEVTMESNGLLSDMIKITKGNKKNPKPQEKKEE